jgi:hypothetical protein
MNPNNTMMMMGSMQTTFYSDPHFEFLFDSWHVDSHEKYAGAVVGLFFFSAFLPVLNYVTDFLELKRKQ